MNRFWNLEKRKKLEQLLKENLSCREIGGIFKLGSHATVLNEIKRCGSREHYSAEWAQEHAQQKKRTPSIWEKLEVLESHITLLYELLEETQNGKNKKL